MGLYPSAPGRRMGWDDDGTVALIWYQIGDYHDAPPAEMTAVEKQTFNNESEATAFADSFGGTSLYSLIFPELREFDGMFYEHKKTTLTPYTSGDTTNGMSGTWTARTSQSASAAGSVRPEYRTAIQSYAVSNVRAIRFDGTYAGNSFHARALHVYGEISPGETPDRLLFIDELTGLEFAQPKDFEEVPRGSAQDWQFRLKNNSTVVGNNLTINNVQFTAEDLYLVLGDWITFSIAGDAFAGTKQITSLAPEASSALITGRLVVPEEADFGLLAARIEATVGSVS